MGSKFTRCNLELCHRTKRHTGHALVSDPFWVWVGARVRVRVRVSARVRARARD